MLKGPRFIERDLLPTELEKIIQLSIGEVSDGNYAPPINAEELDSDESLEYDELNWLKNSDTCKVAFDTQLGYAIIFILTKAWKGDYIVDIYVSGPKSIIYHVSRGLRVPIPDLYDGPQPEQFMERCKEALRPKY